MYILDLNRKHLFHWPELLKQSFKACIVSRELSLYPWIPAQRIGPLTIVLSSKCTGTDLCHTRLLLCPGEDNLSGPGN